MILLAAGAAFAQPVRDLAAERQQATQLMSQGQSASALPLLEDLASANPDDAAVEGWLGYCLWIKSRNSATPEEAEALRKRARVAGLRARQLGRKWPLLNDLFTALDSPSANRSPLTRKPTTR